MSAMQQLRNFIRHGKPGRAANADESARAKANNPPPQAEQPAAAQSNDATKDANNHHKNNMAPSEPALGAAAAAGKYVDVPAAYSAAQVDAQNRAAGAGHVAGHVAGHGAEAGQANGRSRRDEDIAKLVAEENASKSKFTRYPGLERWELLEKMGDGAFSNVYRARDLQGNTGEVAIKVVRKYEMNSTQGDRVLHPEFKKVPKAAERANILKEVQIMKQLDHPNIVKLIDFSESREYYYIILELAPGGELFHQIVRLTYFGEDLSRHVITQVAKALEYLHEERGVVHRDIKPENILYIPVPSVPSKHPKPKKAGDEDKVDEGEFIPGVGAGGIGQIKIADFGLSKIVWDNQTMTPCGTVGYTAPEIVKDERYSKSVDMWALGCVLYTLLCGFPPFYDESIEVLTEKVAKGQYTFLSPWWDDISKSAQDLITHLLCVDAEKRYTIREFLAHPWVRAAGPSPGEEKKAASVLRAFDGNRLSDFRSPGAVNLREVFDVGYAVHRQEEEGKRRKQMGASKAGVSRLVGLNEASDEEEEEEEEEKEEDEDEDAEMGDDAGTAPRATRSLEQSMRSTHIRDAQAVDAPRGRDRERHPRVEVHQPPQQQKGYGQHSATVTAAARQQVRDRNRQKGAFELNLNGATLLGRRAKPTAPVA